MLSRFFVSKVVSWRPVAKDLGRVQDSSSSSSSSSSSGVAGGDLEATHIMHGDDYLDANFDVR